MKKSQSLMIVSVLFVGMLFSSGCASPMYQQNQSAFNQGALGALIGGVAGAVIGNNSNGAFGNGEGAVAGAALGGLLGGTMGHQKDGFNQQLGAVNETASTTIINVHNTNGSITPVTIRKAGNQYIGPRGEYYGALPTEQQLKGPYGF